MNRVGWLGLILGAGAGLVTLIRRLHQPIGKDVAGGTLIGDTASYDRMARWLLGGFYEGIARNVATTTPRGARVLEIGCGPGHLAIRLAREHGLEVTGLDLDPAMIARAEGNAGSATVAAPGTLGFVVGDVAALPFPDASFDVVVSTMSMHHWADPEAGLLEIERVLQPGGRALIWDFRAGALPFHRDMPDPLATVHRSSLRVASVDPWRWPWPFNLTRRIELVAAEGTTRA